MTSVASRTQNGPSSSRRVTQAAVEGESIQML